MEDEEWEDQISSGPFCTDTGGQFQQETTLCYDESQKLWIWTRSQVKINEYWQLESTNWIQQVPHGIILCLNILYFKDTGGLMLIYKRRKHPLDLLLIFFSWSWFLAKAYAKTFQKWNAQLADIKNYAYIIINLIGLQKEASYVYYVELNMPCSGDNKSNLEVIEKNLYTYK